MIDYALPVVIAAFLWWFSTGLVLLLDGLPRTTYRWSLAASSGLALIGLAAIAATARDISVVGAYVAFVGALLVWGWQELTFLTGAVTGPRRQGSSARRGSRQHFAHAVAAILWHELAIAAAGLLIAAMVWHGSNPVALWTYLVLWTMRTSAKLNLFLGVRNANADLLPPHLSYLQTYFQRRSLNALFPLSVAAGTVVACLLVQRALAPEASAGQVAGVMLVAALMALAVIEHWLMVLPININALWQWALRTPAAAVAAPVIAPPREGA